jgi:ElaB/YqjD/DUF883 family membrane-anchored ribosome-binding protein
MADETAPAQKPENLEVELEKSRESAARLLETLARKVGAVSAVRSAKGGLHRAAHYVHAHSTEDMAAEIERLVCRRPAYSIGVAIVAGFLVGRALRPR